MQQCSLRYNCRTGLRQDEASFWAISLPGGQCFWVSFSPLTLFVLWQLVKNLRKRSSRLDTWRKALVGPANQGKHRRDLHVRHYHRQAHQVCVNVVPCSHQCWLGVGQLSICQNSVTKNRNLAAVSSQNSQEDVQRHSAVTCSITRQRTKWLHKQQQLQQTHSLYSGSHSPGLQTPLPQLKT